MKSCKLLLLTGFIVVFTSCAQTDRCSISGQMDYVGSSDIMLQKQQLHYKYSPTTQYRIQPQSNGRFQVNIPVDSTEVVNFVIDEQRYPVIASPGEQIELNIQRASFPKSVSVDGYTQEWDKMYTSFLSTDNKILQSIERGLPAFRNGEPNDVLELYKNRISVAKRHLGDTPLEIYYHKAIGEYLVKRLESIKYRRGQDGFDPEKERQLVLEKAKKYNFFTFEVLANQRAGIRDFTNAYANTFGVEQQIEQQYGQELMQYDIKRLGYSTLDSARTSVLDHIEGRKAKAYARMHLVAERIGEMSPQVAEASYRDYLNEYEDFQEYTAFLREFYGAVKSVSPGQPAADFALPNQYGELVEMEDFEGKYVLLDFWAPWCIPCLDEFPHMRDLYKKYSRDNFEIVAISIEEDSLVWRRAIQRFENPWVQLYGGNGFEQHTFKEYRGGGIPFYILVNPKGNIERYNDVRPSFNLDQVLDSLITQQGT
ncbi:TlpA family protein disulfide reductase [Aliifodinibius sp. S!AR15-10]|uniref:TlpA family protein disulfide reductase n=1 Tax=Aliifodinibius sp. S!AR15-10 TaxID=2950437 RepID=UPI002861FE52|nr:TlpA disulfide reductase family protein [Aliifodinibius sp. S!AR15-10]MDR8392106.1 TlpA family protein disulfide reductase [Aliifodinibius sp. S!AR15-10]